MDVEVEPESQELCQPRVHVVMACYMSACITWCMQHPQRMVWMSDQALVMMGGPAGRVPAVREYALRSLQACNPDQVTPAAAPVRVKSSEVLSQLLHELSGL